MSPPGRRNSNLFLPNAASGGFMSVSTVANRGAILRVCSCSRAKPMALTDMSHLCIYPSRTLWTTYKDILKLWLYAKIFDMVSNFEISNNFRTFKVSWNESNLSFCTPVPPFNSVRMFLVGRLLLRPPISVLNAVARRCVGVPSWPHCELYSLKSPIKRGLKITCLQYLSREAFNNLYYPFVAFVWYTLIICSDF